MYCPDAYANLKRNKVPVDLYASNWFVTMFSCELGFEVVPAVIDLYLLEGKAGLIKIALAIIEILSPVIAEMQPDELFELMS